MRKKQTETTIITDNYYKPRIIKKYKRTIRLNEFIILLKCKKNKITGNNIITGKNVFRDDNIPNEYNDLTQELEWYNVFEIIDQYYKRFSLDQRFK